MVTGYRALAEVIVLWFRARERETPDREVRVRALAGSVVLCSWARYFTLTVPLSTQEYKWVPANCQGNLTKCWGWGLPAMD